MEPENLDVESITEARRKAIEQTIEPISIEQLKSLGEKIFPFFDHPWRHTFFQFVEENSGSTFYHATADDQVEIIYCPDKGKGYVVPPARGPRTTANHGTSDSEGYRWKVRNRRRMLRLIRH